MAHIKVVRRSMRPEDYIRLRYGWLKRYRYRDMTPLSPVMIRNARQTGENSFEFYEDEPYELKPGDLYYTPDGSVFFTVDAALSGIDRSRPLYLFYQTTGEVIVKVNGHWAGGVDPNRELVDLTPYLTDEMLHIEMLGFNRSKPDDERNPDTMAKRGCRQVFEGIFLCRVDENVRALCYDLELLTDMLGAEIFDEDLRAFLTRETDAALNCIDFDDVRDADVSAARRYIEDHIYGNTTYRGSGRVALVAHSHLDIAYYWRRIHTVQKNLRTVLLQMRLMDKYPDFTYCHTQPYLYETLREHYPEVFAELTEKVKAGRFEPVGAMYVEPDCNIPNAESLIRQCLYGQTFYEEAFGFTVDTCWLPDVFGNSAILPQILKKSGVDYFVSNKMSTWNDTNRFPHNSFRWRGLDGTEVYASVPPTHFISWNEPSGVAENWAAYQDKNTGVETLQMFGYGDGGSGATEEMIELMRRFDRLPGMPKTRHVTAKTYLHENFTPDKPLSVWDGELYLEMHRGTFTTKAKLKDYNRRLEEKFRAAELVSLFGESKGEYPAGTLRRLYKKFLLQQFHDILPGSHITPVFEDAVRDLEEIEAGLDAILRGDGAPTDLTGFTRDGCEFLPDETGPATRRGVRGRFVRIHAEPFGAAKEIPAEADDWLREENGNWIVSGQDGSPVLTVRFAPDGAIDSLQSGGCEYAAEGFNRLRLFDDKPGVYDAWDILPDYEEKALDLTLTRPLALTLQTPDFAEFTAQEGTEKSRIVRVIRLFRGEARIETEVRADWQEDHKLLKVGFPTPLRATSLVTDTSAGFLRRPLHKNTSWEQARFEVCSHKYFVIDAERRGIAVYNDGKYGVGATENGVSLSLLRATERPDPTADRGAHCFCYAIEPLTGPFLSSGVPEKALRYSSPLLPVGPLRVPAFLTRLAGTGVLSLSAAKLSEDGRRLILRLTELKGETRTLPLDRTVTVCDLLERPVSVTDKLEIRPFEIITLATDR